MNNLMQFKIIFSILLLAYLFSSGVAIACQKSGYYRASSLDFRAATETPPQGKDKSTWEKMDNANGKTLFVNKTIELNAGDVDRIAISESKQKQFTDDCWVMIYFKTGSREKVSKVTQRLLKQRLAIIKQNRIFSAPVIQERLDVGSAQLSGFTPSDTKDFVEGMTYIEPFSEPDSYLSQREFAITREMSVDYKANNNDYWLAIRLAYRYMNGPEKDKYRAETIFTNAIKTHPQETEAYDGLVEYYMSTRQAGKAEKVLLNAIEANPNNEWYYMYLASIYALSLKYDEAIDIAQKAINFFPEKEWVSRKTLAEIYIKQGNYNKAISEYQKSLKLLEDSDFIVKDKYIQQFNERINELRKINTN
ncbi:tetratricopeptide repeat protein [Nitrospirota bacterium]